MYTRVWVDCWFIVCSSSFSMETFGISMAQNYLDLKYGQNGDRPKQRYSETKFGLHQSHTQNYDKHANINDWIWCTGRKLPIYRQDGSNRNSFWGHAWMRCLSLNMNECLSFASVFQYLVYNWDIFISCSIIAILSIILPLPMVRCLYFLYWLARPRKHRSSRWNHSAIMPKSLDLSTSGWWPTSSISQWHL